MTRHNQTTLGFRDAPDIVTRSCLEYMGRVMELRDFVSFYFSFVKTSSKIKSIFDNAPSNLPAVSNQEIRVIEYNFSFHRQFVNEIMLCRAVESFNLYILNILREIFSAKPEILKSKKQLDISTLIELRTPEEIIMYLAENQLNELGYKPLRDLCKWVKDRTGIDVFRSTEIFEIAQIASEIRNLIAHNDCRANGTLAKRIGKNIERLEISDSGKVIVSDELVRKFCYTLDGAVFDFDEAAGDKFAVQRSNRNESTYNR